MDWSKTLQEPKFWLLAIAAAIVVIHLSLLSRLDNSDIFATSVLFWLAVGSLIWDNHETFNLESGWVASIIGFLILALVLLRSAFSPDSVSSAWALPFVATLGLGLLAAGFKGLRQFWKELTIFGLLAIYPLLQLTLQAIDLSELTAIAASFNLSYLGFPVQRQGVFLVLPTSRVEVYGACSGIQSILQLLCISVLFLLMFPLRSRWQRVLTVVAAVVIAFVVNAARVALMAILNNAGDKNAFDYWHEGTGSLIFSAIAVLIFGSFCWFAFLRKSGQKPDSGAQGNA
ncbi:exosortase, cyanobacterial variant [Leptolyngbyaceae cyanobacterium JSC-12]|nr:exosortase, cyanobacterial variant [Leptolyngbyaceae cyanobacterium JSC-12]